MLYKVEHLATDPPEGDIAVEGLKLAGPGWDDRLKSLLSALSQSERACLFAVRLSDEQALPLPAETLLDRGGIDGRLDGGRGVGLRGAARDGEERGEGDRRGSSHRAAHFFTGTRESANAMI